jgi:hypothetical protein
MSKQKSPLNSDEKLNLIIQQIKELHKKIDGTQITMNELKSENKLILEDTLKMGKHIDFIDKSYEKIGKSYIFRNIFS